MTGFDSKRQAALDKLFEVENELGLHYEPEPKQKPVGLMVVGDCEFGEYEIKQVFVNHEATHIYWEKRGNALVPFYIAAKLKEKNT